MRAGDDNALPYPLLFFILVLESTMSLEQALEVLEFKSMEDVDMASLKASFKRLALTEHPDHGGSRFDDVMSAYVCLSGVLRRKTGGRDKSGVLHPEDIQRAREEQFTQELNNLVEEVFESVQREETDAFLKSFNEQFLAFREKEDGNFFSSSESRGYSDWLSSEEKSVVSFLPDGPHGPFTMAPPAIQEADLHTLFEYTAKCGKPPVTDLMLLPDQMAVRVASGGMSLISTTTDSFTSDLLEKPEYSDVQEAFQTNNTIVDKLPVFQEMTRTFEELLKERDIVYQTEEDRDLAAISLYERAYAQQEALHRQRIQEFFTSTGSSQWALPSISPSDPEEEKTPFVITLGL
jgi:hypothetical protein